MSTKVARILLMFCLLLTFRLSLVDNRAISGPYKTIVRQFKNCLQPFKPYVKENMTELHVELKGSVIKGNFTVLKKLANFKISLQDFLYEDGKWQLVFNVKNLSCRSRTLALLVKPFGNIFEKKTCAVLQGTYYFETDYNKLDHMWTNTREYGRMMRRFETYLNAGTISCYEFEIEVMPKK